MKNIDIKPFGLFTLADNVIEDIEINHTHIHSGLSQEQSNTKNTRQIAERGKRALIAIMPDTKKAFHIVPIIVRDALYAGVMPNPIQLYLSTAIEYHNFCGKIMEQLRKQLKPGDVVINQELPLYNDYLKYKIISIIFLHTSVEAFLNYAIPHDIKYEYKAGTILNKKDIEEKVNFKDKLKLLAKELLDIDITAKYDKIYNSLIKLYELRSELVHLKTHRESNNLEITTDIISQVFTNNFEKQASNAIEFINLLKPDFVSLKDS